MPVIDRLLPSRGPPSAVIVRASATRRARLVVIVECHIGERRSTDYGPLPNSGNCYRSHDWYLIERTDRRARLDQICSFGMDNFCANALHAKETNTHAGMNRPRRYCTGCSGVLSGVSGL